MFNGEHLPGWDSASVQDDVNQHILRMFEDIFSFDAAHFIVTQKKIFTWDPFLIRTMLVRESLLSVSPCFFFSSGVLNIVVGKY